MADTDTTTDAPEATEPTVAIDLFEAGPADIGTGPAIDPVLAKALEGIIHGPTKVVASKVVYPTGEDGYKSLRADAAKVRAHLLSVIDTDAESVRLIIRDVDGGQSFAFKLGKARKPRESK